MWPWTRSLAAFMSLMATATVGLFSSLRMGCMWCSGEKVQSGLLVLYPYCCYYELTMNHKIADVTINFFKINFYSWNTFQALHEFQPCPCIQSFSWLFPQLLVVIIYLLNIKGRGLLSCFQNNYWCVLFCQENILTSIKPGYFLKHIRKESFFCQIYAMISSKFYEKLYFCLTQIHGSH